MKFDFTRMTVATSVTVALTCLGNVAWADCYQDGYNDGQKACPACPPLPNCQEGDYDKGLQEGKDSVKLPNCKEGDFEAGKASVIVPNCTEGDYARGEVAGKASVKLPNCKEGDYANGYQEGVNSVAVSNCTEGDYDKGFEAGKASVTVTPLNCQEGDYDKGLQDGKNSVSCQAEYDNGLEKGKQEGNREATLSYTGYVDTTTPTPTAKSCQENPNHEVCKSPKGFTDGYDEGVKWATAQYTGYVDEAQTPSVPKSCSEADANSEECSGKKEGFKEGYVKGLTAAATKENAHQLYTGYVDETGVAHSCQGVQEDSMADPASKEAKCAHRDGFEKGFTQGFTLGQLSLAGYVETDKDGKKVPKSCQEDANNDACKQALQGFTDGYNLGRLEVANSSAEASSSEEPLGEDLENCQETPAAPDTLAECKKNPQSCIINYLQGFYEYFVQRRLQNVTDKEKVFPDSLTVQPFGGLDESTPAEQWRYTWKHKTQGCEAISGNKSKQFEPDGDLQEISICIGQMRDMGTETDPTKPEFGGSKDTSALTHEQSLGYTVYLLDESKKVKATMEIIFSPNEEASSATEDNAPHH